MTLLEIPRVKAGCVSGREVEASGRGELATKAAEKLGYNGLLADVTGARKMGQTTGPLTEALLRLEIDVLDSAQVVAYQVEEAGRHTLAEIHRRFDQWTKGYFSQASWQHTELSRYAEPIPEFVLHKALQVKEACPEVKFYIHHMSDPKADPFLIASLNEEIYYIEAWSEPKFEARL